jgi:hemin uptake protein HemP
MILQTRMIRNTMQHTHRPHAAEETMPDNPPRPPPEPALAETDAADLPVIDSATLLRGGSEIVIRHGEREYRLRRTRFDKLILTA